MSEPEDLILEGAHFATRVARGVWTRYGPAAAPHAVELTSVRTRLELFVTALFQRPIPVAPMEPPAPRTWLSRLATGSARDDRQDVLACGTDGRRVYLPPSLECGDDAAAAEPRAALALYRLLAVQQAARLVRGTPAAAARLGRDDTRDWFLIAEAASIDRWIALNAPGLEGTLRWARSDALARRGTAGARDPARRAIEGRVRELLAADPRARVLDTDPSASAEASRAWAEDASKREPASHRYRPLAPVWYWGCALEASSVGARGTAATGERARQMPQRARVAEMPRRPRPREAPDDEDDEQAGTWVIRADDPQESVEDPFGLQRPADQDDHADPEGLADSLSELPEARIVRTEGQAREVLRAPETVPRGENGSLAAGPGCGLGYPEWDYRTGTYRLPGAVVRERAVPPGDEAWAASALARHARLVRRVRARFERLRPRPVRLLRQPDGSDLDLSAYVTAAADTRAGVTSDGRLYVAVRPQRGELAVALLLDVSASTDAWLAADRRIVDVEKEALLVVCEALDALGDRFGLFAFSGEGAGDVTVLSLKRFDEPAGAVVRRRIAALDADRYTRLGAPVRHLTAALCRERACRRLLIVLSDGKPNDVDVYEGRYGVEDTRQAVAEARRQGVAVFCLTIDREAPRYANRIFGRAGFAVLRRTDQLPSVLIDVLRQMIKP
jgi:nitric oxide reductase NorD protein